MVYYSHNSGCWRSVARWITILSQRTLLTILSSLQIHFCVIFRKTRHHAQAYVTLDALVVCGLSLALRWTKTAAELPGFHRAVLLMAAVELNNICCCHTWSSNQTGGGAILAFSSFFIQIPHQKKSEISVGILIFSFFGRKSWDMSSLLGRSVLHECPSNSSKTRSDLLS